MKIKEKKLHQSVLSKEVIELLQPKYGEIFVDSTLGSGGHAKQILNKIGRNGKLIGIDTDPQAILLAEKRLNRYPNINILYDNFIHLNQILKLLNIQKVDGILTDLGLCSLQIDQAKRGFSFQTNGVLDMRANPKMEKSADQIINQYKQDQLIKIFWEYGEEPSASRIAHQIVRVRQTKPIRTTGQLVEIIRQSLPPNRKFGQRIHFATKIFQALRIEVNQELANLQKFIPQAIQALKSGGRLAIISYHSLEDRIVKNNFKKFAQGCICPSKSPVCTCHHLAEVKILFKKPIVPKAAEIQKNPRSRSAKLRVIEKI